MSTVPGTSPRLLTLRRTGADVVLGIVLIVTGAIVLGDVVLASVVSVLFLGWTMLLGGAIGLAVALFTLSGTGRWVAVLSSAVSLVAGLVFVRWSGVALLALSLAVGALLLVGGITRMVTAAQVPEQRVVLLLSGALTVVLGLMILNRWPSSALWLLGTLLGIQIVVDGVLLILLGRPRMTPANP